MHTVMNRAAFGRQGGHVLCGPCLVDGPVRIGISNEYGQCRTNRDPREQRFRHDDTLVEGATPQGVLRVDAVSRLLHSA